MEAPVENLSQIEREVIRFVNLFRSKPQYLVEHLQDRMPFYQDKLFRRKGKKIMTNEGLEAASFALRFARARVKANNKLPKLETHKNLTRCTEAFKEEVGNMRHIGHLSANGDSLKTRVMAQFEGKTDQKWATSASPLCSSKTTR